VVEFTWEGDKTLNYCVQDERCFMLSTTGLYVVKLKSWSEYLEDLSCNGE